MKVTTQKSRLNHVWQEQLITLPPLDVFESVKLLKKNNIKPQLVVLDPWYNKGVGGERIDYVDYIVSILDEVKDITDHVYLWGFPEIVARFVDKTPAPLVFRTWLTWYYKNNPSVIRGWRSSQQTCLHFAKDEAKMYPEHFFSEEQKDKYKNGKMRFIPGPASVIEESLLVGFIGKKEQTGHPAQKPEKVYEKIIKMVTKENDLVYDPMCGSGTTGAVCLNTKRKCILSDISEEYISFTEKRLNTKRVNKRFFSHESNNPSPRLN